MNRIPLVSADSLSPAQQPVYDAIVSAPNRGGRLPAAFAALSGIHRQVAANGLLRYRTGLPPHINELAAVDNRPGAGGALAAVYAAKAAPDGYAIMLGTNATHAGNVSLFKNLTYDPITDFAPITLAESALAFLVVPADSPLKSVGEFRGVARAKRGDVSI